MWEHWHILGVCPGIVGLNASTCRFGSLLVPSSLALCPPHLPPQHPDTCCVSVHPECTGRPFPTGPYICMNHDSRELKTRIRRRASSALARSGEGDEEDEETEEEGGEDGGGAQRTGGGGRDADSEATVSEATQSLDSDATEDEGTSSRRKRKR